MAASESGEEQRLGTLGSDPGGKSSNRITLEWVLGGEKESKREKSIGNRQLLTTSLDWRG